MIVVYEGGTLLYGQRYYLIAEGGMTWTRPVIQHVTARLWLLSFFEWFGVTGFLVPGLVVVTVLVGWHLVRRDPWQLDLRLYLLMGVESFLLALPLLMFMATLGPIRLARVEGAVCVWKATMWPVAAGAAFPALEGLSWPAQLMFALGAGIYEELLFRLIAIAVLHFVLVDWLAVPDFWGSVIAVVVSSVAFAMYHFVGPLDFSWGLLGVYSIAGLYLACVYVLRGIGVVAGAHAIYDMLAILWYVLR